MSEQVAQQANHGASGALRGGTLAASDGRRLVYLRSGTGPTVVFVHGGLARASGWIGVTDLLADTFTCVLVDQRGHGASDWGGGPDVGRASDDLLSVIDHVGPVHAVVGHSYGALVALEAARQATAEQIPRLVLYEPPLSVAAPIMDDATLREVEVAVASGEFEAALRLHLGSASGGLSDTEIDAFCSTPMLRPTFTELVLQAPSIAPALRSCVQLDAAEPYRTIAAPTLLLLGSASATHPFRTTVDALLSALPHAELAVLEGQTHTALLFAPQLVAAETRRFLEGEPGDR